MSYTTQKNTNTSVCHILVALTCGYHHPAATRTNRHAPANAEQTQEVQSCTHLPNIKCTNTFYGHHHHDLSIIMCPAFPWLVRSTAIGVHMCACSPLPAGKASALMQTTTTTMHCRYSDNYYNNALQIFTLSNEYANMQESVVCSALLARVVPIKLQHKTII